MLGKLLQYDLRAMWKKFALLWPAVLIVAVFNQIVVFVLRLMDDIDFSLTLGGMDFLLAVIPGVVYFGLMVALAVVSMLYVVQRFYVGLLGDEGYLMHTLPVKTWQLIFSKLVTATIAVIVSCLVGLLSIAILAENGNIFHILRDWTPHFRGFSDFVVFLEFFLLAVLMLWGSISKIYAACAIGQLSNKNRLLCSVGAYIGLNTAQTAISLTGFFILGRLEEATGFLHRVLETVGRILEAALRSQVLQGIVGDGAALAFHSIMGVFCLYYLFKTAIFFFITEYLLRKKLNLQ